MDPWLQNAELNAECHRSHVCWVPQCIFSLLQSCQQHYTPLSQNQKNNVIIHKFHKLLIKKQANKKNPKKEWHASTSYPYFFYSMGEKKKSTQKPNRITYRSSSFSLRLQTNFFTTELIKSCRCDCVLTVTNHHHGILINSQRTNQWLQTVST